MTERATESPEVGRTDSRGSAEHEDLRIDELRSARTGLPEIIFGEGKSTDQCVRAFRRLIAAGVEPAMVSRVDAATAAVLLDEVPEAVHDPIGRIVSTRKPSRSNDSSTVGVICAGTSDLPVARECSGTLSAFGVSFEMLTDVGVAGLHRLIGQLDSIRRWDITIVVAGMEGALPSVVAGLVTGPVIAVPTSIGYGSSFDGLAALLSMMNSCSPGITVVNIDSGLGAAVAAIRILELAS